MSGDVDTKRRALRIARVELLQRAARFGALANKRGAKTDSCSYENAALNVEIAARKFTQAEDELAAAERPGPRPTEGGTT